MTIAPPAARATMAAFRTFYNSAIRNGNAADERLYQETIRIGLRRARDRAIKKGVPFSLTLAGLVGMMEAQGRRCALSGISFSFKDGASAAASPYQPSIDRVIPERGYVPDNVQWVLHAVNLGKGQMSTSDYLRICAAASENRARTK